MLIAAYANRKALIIKIILFVRKERIIRDILLWIFLLTSVLFSLLWFWTERSLELNNVCLFMYTPTADDKSFISSVYPVSSQYVYSENYLEEAGSLESQITRMQGKHLFFLRVSGFVFPGGRLSYCTLIRKSWVFVLLQILMS